MVQLHTDCIHSCGTPITWAVLYIVYINALYIPAAVWVNCDFCIVLTLTLYYSTAMCSFYIYMFKNIEFFCPMYLTLKEVLFTVLDLNESSAKDVKASLSESAEDKRERRLQRRQWERKSLQCIWTAEQREGRLSRRRIWDRVRHAPQSTSDCWTKPNGSAS